MSAAAAAAGAAAGPAGQAAGSEAGAPPPSPRQQRRGPAPIASFDHDVSDESSPESKLTFQLPEIREDGFPNAPGAAAAGAATAAAAGAAAAGEGALAVPPGRARSASSPQVGALQATPRIDISRASSSSHQDSRDSSPELALFSGAGDDAALRLDLAFREDGALDLRSSTEELAFLEGAAEPGHAGPAGEHTATAPAAPRRHSRKDSQGSEAALLGVCGRQSRLSSVGSACSAVSAYSHVSRLSRLSVASGDARSPSPHKMLLETSFCGPKPIETDDAELDAAAAAVEERLLELAGLAIVPAPTPAPPPAPAPAPPPAPAPAPVQGLDPARDRREVRAEVTVESAGPRLRPNPAPPPAAAALARDEDKRDKEIVNRARQEERRSRARTCREESLDKPEVFRSRNKSKDVIRIRLKPHDQYDSDSVDDEDAAAPALAGPAAATPPRRESRSPSPAAPARGAVSRKSSFCSLFKSKETIPSPESPAAGGGSALRRKRSADGGKHDRSKSRDRSASRGSVLSLFRTPRRSPDTSRAASPAAPAPRPAHPAHPAAPPPPGAERLKYYEPSADGVIHIPLHTPPDEPACSARPSCAGAGGKPLTRTVLPDGSIIIPLHSPTEKVPAHVPELASPPPGPSEPSRPAESRQETEPSRVTQPRQQEVGCETATRCSAAATTTSVTTTRDTASATAAPATTATVHCGAGLAGGAEGSGRRRLVFRTAVGSHEQLFSTQLSVASTPGAGSEPCAPAATTFPEPAPGPPPLRDTHITSDTDTPAATAAAPAPARSPSDLRVDSSGSEPSSEAAGTSAGASASAALGAGAGGEEVRGLVGGGSFEEELPWVPTTLPQERPRALPMLPVRERAAGITAVPRGAALQRPRGVAPAPGPPRAPTAPAPSPSASERLHIQLPRRPRPASAAAAPAAAQAAAPAPRPSRERTRSSGGEWVDFEEVPERRKQPKRIQTLPQPPPASEEVLYSYVEPEECRCECHLASASASASAGAERPDDEEEQPLLTQLPQPSATPSPESAGVAAARGAGAAPFTADFDLRSDHHHGHQEPSSRRQ